MATKIKQGRRFGSDKGVQRNKENEPGQKDNRSPGQSNADKPFPSLNEDVIKTQKRDLQRMGRGILPQVTEVTKAGKPTTEAQKNMGRSAQREAGLRAGSRTAVRGGLIGAGIQIADASYDAGFNYAKSKNEASMKEIDDRATFKNLVNRDESKPKLFDFESSDKSSAPSKSTSARKVSQPSVKVDQGGVTEGPNKNIGDDVRARAMESVKDLEDVNSHKWKGTM